MNASKLFADIATNCLTEVPQAACVFDDQARGVRVRQSFYVYPDDTIVSLLSADGSYEVIVLDDEASSIFRNKYQDYFYF